MHGPHISAGEPTPERTDPNYRGVVLERRLRQSLRRLNPGLPPEALEDAYRKLTPSDTPSLLERNRALQRMVVDGVTVAYGCEDGSIAGTQARVIDFGVSRTRDLTSYRRTAGVSGVCAPRNVAIAGARACGRAGEGDAGQRQRPQSRTLSSLRAALLAKLMSSEARVSDVHTILEDAP